MLKHFWRVFQSNVNKKDRQKFLRTYELVDIFCYLSLLIMSKYFQTLMGMLMKGT